MAHHHLGFHLLCGIQGNANQNDNRSTAEGQIMHAGKCSKDDGSSAISARNRAPIKVILERILAIKSDVGLPGRMPGIVPLF